MPHSGGRARGHVVSMEVGGEGESGLLFCSLGRDWRLFLSVYENRVINCWPEKPRRGWAQQQSSFCLLVFALCRMLHVVFRAFSGTCVALVRVAIYTPSVLDLLHPVTTWHLLGDICTPGDRDKLWKT